MTRQKLFIIFFLFPFAIYGSNDSLWTNIHNIAIKAEGKVSVSARLIEDSSYFNYYGDEMCAMQSVFKFPIALAVLNRIDKNEFSLQHKIHFTLHDLKNYTESTQRDSFYTGNINITFDKLIRYMVSQSDNISCDALIHQIGKPKDIAKFINKNGVEDIEIKYDEVTMGRKWKNQYKNVCSPNAMTLILEKFYTGKLLSKNNTDYLYQVMLETTTGKNRIIKLLPKGTKVAHKTGTSNSKDGMTAAVNDCGIIELPNGKHLAVAIFISDTKASMETAESVIAEIAQTLYASFAN
ncbi:MAG: Extended-spectrum beta-lactamase precursor [Bacteroidota bacterium]|jgi:beta-lactamase class A